MDKLKKFLNIFSYVFNAIYLFLCFPFALSLFEMQNTAFNLMAPLGLVFLLPLGFFLLVSFKKTRVQSLKFFFGVEIPLLFLSLFRIIFLRELTFFYIFLLISIILTIALFSINLFNNKKFEKISVYIYEIPVILCAYFSILALFFIIPLLILLIKSLLTINYFNLIAQFMEFLVSIDFSEIIGAIYLILLLIFFLLVTALFFLSPITSVIVYWKQFISEYKKTNNKKNCIIFAFIYIVFFFLSSIYIPDSSFDKDYKALLSAKNYNELKKVQISPIKEFFIKKAYLNNYLASQRFVFDENSDFVEFLFEEAFDYKQIGTFAQFLFNKIAYPFYYPESFRNNRINDKFVEFFNDDIQVYYKDSIKNSIDSTFFNKNTTATLLDIDSKDVFVKNRTIKINKTKTDSIYKVSYLESYKNRKNDQKEVYYEFSLPKNAVIVGLSLGDKLQYKGVISPKNAARKTYLAQTQRRQDPALLEKNGPIQYTLRVFPIPPKRQKQNQKVEFEYLVYSLDGVIPLPNFSQVRNANFNYLSKESIIYNNSIKLKKKDNKVFVKTAKSSGINYPRDKKIAILFDSSYSNKTNWKEFTKNELSMIEKNNSVDYYFFNKFLSPKLNSLDNQRNYSKSARYDAYCSLDNDYDLSIMFTTNSVFDYSKFNPCKNNFPLYVIHLSKTNSIPPYTKAMSELIYRTKGAIGSSLEEVFLDNTIKPDSGSTETQVFNSKEKIDSLLPDKKEEIFDIAKKYNIVSDYSSLISLVSENQKKQLELNEKQKDKFDADLLIGKETGFQEKSDIKTVPEPQEYLFIILLFLFTIIITKKKRKC